MKSWSALLVDLLPALLLGGLVFHMLRSHVAERYLVPSESMEPTLHGSEYDGDVVLVDKTAWLRPSLHSPKRFDLVVVRNRDDASQNHIVKRVAAVGPTALELREGDLFARDPESGAMRRVVKRPLQHPDMCQTGFEFDASDPASFGWIRITAERAEPVDGALLVPARPAAELVEARRPEARDARRLQRIEQRREALDRGAMMPLDPVVPGHLSSAGAINSSFKTLTGGRLPGGSGWPRDIGIDVTVELPRTGVRELQLVIEHLEVYYALRYGVGGEGQFEVMGEDEGESFAGPPLEAGARHRLRFGYLDGRFFFAVGDRLALWRERDIPLRAEPELRIRDRVDPPVINRLHIAAAGDPETSLRLLRLRGFHDIHYQPEEGRYELEEGQLFLLGDNSFDSSDSRAPARRADPYDLDDLVGRPACVIAPFERRRWL